MHVYLKNNVGNFKKHPSSRLLEPFLESLSAISELQARISEDQVERLDKIGLFGMRDLLEKTSELAIWTDFEESQ